MDGRRTGPPAPGSLPFDKLRTCFHLVFTLPHALGPLIRSNPRRLYSLLFTTAAATLREFALDPRYLGAEPAITMVLHTWGQTLTQHVHVHCVISAAGLSVDGRRWVALRRRRRAFLFPVSALSRLFRGKYIAALERARQQGKLRFSGQSAALAEEQDWQPWIATLWQSDWVVYAKHALSSVEGPPFGGAEQVLKYLSRYTHRIAISNHRILFVGDGLVRFTYKDYADHHRTKVMTLGAKEFLRRFLLHVLPRGFMRIRHYGILANCRRRQKLARCRELLGLAARAPSAETSASSPNTDAFAPDDHCGRCPQCGGRLRVVEILPPEPIDSS